MDRGDSLIPVLLGTETRLIRAELGPPLAEAFTDLAEAFDTIHALAVVFHIWEGAGVLGEDSAAAAQMLEHTQVRVVSRGAVSETVPLPGGMPEGRWLASAFYAGAARCFEVTLGDDACGVGFDPPEEAVAAFHAESKPDNARSGPSRVW